MTAVSPGENIFFKLSVERDCFKKEGKATYKESCKKRGERDLLLFFSTSVPCFSFLHGLAYNFFITILSK